MRIAGSGRGRRQSSKLASLGIFALLVGVLAACDTTPVVLSGTVSAAPSGHGVGGVTVAVYADDAETLVDQTTTNLLGAYALHTSSVADGSYRVRIGDRWWPDAASWADADTVELTEASSTTIDIALDEIGSLSGRVVDDRGDPLADVVVAAVRVADGQTVAVDPTDAAGDFRVPVVTPGAHRVVLADPAETWPQMSVGASPPTQLDVTGGDVPVGTIDLSTGHPYTSGNVITRVSLTSDGTQPDNYSYEPSISGDGRFVAFSAWASNLVVGDTNQHWDVFVHDRGTGTTSRVSVASDGTQSNGESRYPFISEDGRHVIFRSHASNLVAGDTNGFEDVFVHDRTTGETSRVSVATNGTQADGSSADPSISESGRYVAFSSHASNLVAGDTNSSWDVFVHDRTTGATSRVSTAPDVAQTTTTGSGSPSISGDGRYVAFLTNGRLVAEDNNQYTDVYVHDRSTGAKSLVSVASDGTGSNSGSFYPSISADGRHVSFESGASNLVPGDTNGFWDVFVHDRTTRTTGRVSVASDGTQATDGSTTASLSGDGRYVAFYSFASTLVDGDTNGRPDVFVHDRSTGVTSRVSLAPDGSEGNENSFDPSFSSDGRFVAFTSNASNLVAGDTNGHADVFVLRRARG